jgi:small ligand-binding sensory domain FIST
MARFATALSEHPLATHAVGEIVGEVLDQLEGSPDTVVLFVSRAHTGVFEDIARTVGNLLSPGVLVGCSTRSTLAGTQEVEHVPSVALWAGITGDSIAVRIPVVSTQGLTSSLETAFESNERMSGGTLLMFVDPVAAMTGPMLRDVQSHFPDLTITGATASAGNLPGSNRFALDDRLYSDGAVGVILPPECPLVVAVSHGAEALGDPFTVTRCERNMVIELAGAPAMSRLQQIVGALDPVRRARLGDGVLLGSIPDDHLPGIDTTDFILHKIRGTDPENGALALDGEVTLGATVQFHLRDALSADVQLRAALADVEGSSALVFTDVGRGMRLFDEPDHDAATIVEMLGSRAVAGMFGGSEIAPVGGVPTIHRASVVSVIFGDRPPLRFRP